MSYFFTQIAILFMFKVNKIKAVHTAKKNMLVTYSEPFLFMLSATK